MAIDIQLIYYSNHSTTVLDKQTGVKFWLCTTSVLGGNFSQLLYIQEVHWYHASKCSSFEHPARSIYIDIQFTIANIALVYWRSKRVCSSAVYDKRS